MLRGFCEEGGRQVVVNSDAHRLDQMGCNNHLATRILREAGLEPTRLRVGPVAVL